MGVSRVSVADRIQRAQGGDWKAGEALIRLFAFRAHSKEGDELDRYLANSLVAIVDRRVAPMKALNLTRGRGRIKDRSPAKITSNALLFHAVEEARNNGASYQDALAQVAEDNNMSESTVERAVSDHRDWLLGL